MWCVRLFELLQKRAALVFAVLHLSDRLRRLASAPSMGESELSLSDFGPFFLALLESYSGSLVGFHCRSVLFLVKVLQV